MHSGCRLLFSAFNLQQGPITTIFEEFSGKGREGEF